MGGGAHTGSKPDRRLIRAMEDDEAKLRLRAGEVSWREVGDEAVVLESSTGMYLTLNPSGKVLWQALERGATKAEMAAMLVEQYGIGEDLAASDVEAFLEGLRARGLVEADDG